MARLPSASPQQSLQSSVRGLHSLLLKVPCRWRLADQHSLPDMGMLQTLLAKQGIVQLRLGRKLQLAWVKGAVLGQSQSAAIGRAFHRGSPSQGSQLNHLRSDAWDLS